MDSINREIYAFEQQEYDICRMERFSRSSNNDVRKVVTLRECKLSYLERCENWMERKSGQQRMRRIII